MSIAAESVRGKPLHHTFWDKIRMLFGTTITWEWCVVGCQLGRHSWSVYLEKCYNGTPVISGGFLTVYKFEDEESARTCCTNFEEIAKKLNKERNYAE